MSDLALLAARSEALLLAVGVLVGLGGISSSIPAAVIAGSVPAERLGGAILDRVGFEAGLVLAAAAVAVGLVFVAALVRPAAAPGTEQGGV